MILIIGGAYQGKRDFAKQSFQLEDGDIFTCTPGNIDFSRKCVEKIEEFTYGCPNPTAIFRKNRDKWKDSILICQDIFCGVVPMGEENRHWRQETAKLCQYLAGEADRVSRIFCGLEQRLK